MITKFLRGFISGAMVALLAALVMGLLTGMVVWLSDRIGPLAGILGVMLLVGGLCGALLTMTAPET